MSHQTAPSHEKTRLSEFPEEVVMASRASDGIPVPHKRYLRMSADIAYYRCSAHGESVRVAMNERGEIQEAPHKAP